MISHSSMPACAMPSRSRCSHVWCDLCFNNALQPTSITCDAPIRRPSCHYSHGLGFFLCYPRTSSEPFCSMISLVLRPDCSQPRFNCVCECCQLSGKLIWCVCCRRRRLAELPQLRLQASFFQYPLYLVRGQSHSWRLRLYYSRGWRVLDSNSILPMHAST